MNSIPIRFSDTASFQRYRQLIVIAIICAGIAVVFNVIGQPRLSYLLPVAFITVIGHILYKYGTGRDPFTILGAKYQILTYEKFQLKRSRNHAPLMIYWKDVQHLDLDGNTMNLILKSGEKNTIELDYLDPNNLKATQDYLNNIKNLRQL